MIKLHQIFLVALLRMVTEGWRARRKEDCDHLRALAIQLLWARTAY